MRKQRFVSIDDLKRKGSTDWYNKQVEKWNNMDAENQQLNYNKIKPLCEDFMKTDEYASGEKDYAGYMICCEFHDFCGGMSGWIIFLIIVLVLAALAAAAAGFWFFYLKRKLGGKEVDEQEKDSEESSTKSYYDISIGTY